MNIVFSMHLCPWFDDHYWISRRVEWPIIMKEIFLYMSGSFISFSFWFWIASNKNSNYIISKWSKIQFCFVISITYIIGFIFNYHQYEMA